MKRKNIRMFPEHILKFKSRKKANKRKALKAEAGWDEENWFNLQLLSDGEIPIKEVNVVALISLLKGHKFTVSQVCHHCHHCHHFDNKQYWTCWFLQRCFFFVGRKLEPKKIHDLFEMVAECFAAPHFWVHKKVWPPPHSICTNPAPLINDRSLNSATIQAAC